MTFTAGAGSYSVGATGDIAAEVANYGLAQWNFTLSSGVRLTTAHKESIVAPQLSLVQYISRQTGKQRQEVICRQGATISKGATSVHAEGLNYHPALQSADAFNGVTVRVTPPNGRPSLFTTSTAFWTLKDSTLRCPYIVTGTIDGYGITASNVALNSKSHSIEASSASINMDYLPPAATKLHNKKAGHLNPSLPQPSTTGAPVAGYAVVTFNPLSGNQSKGLYRGYNFTYVHNDETAKGDYAIWNSHEQLLTAKGHLVYDSNDYGATCSSAQVNRKTHERIFEGAVALTIKPRKSTTAVKATSEGASNSSSPDASGQEARNHDIIVHCDKVVYSSVTKIAKLTGHLLFTQNYVDKKGKKISRNATAEYAVYDDNEQTITLYPPVRYHDSQGEVLVTDDPLVISTRTNDETFSGKATTLLIPDSVLNENKTGSVQPQPTAPHKSAEPLKSKSGASSGPNH